MSCLVARTQNLLVFLLVMQSPKTYLRSSDSINICINVFHSQFTGNYAPASLAMDVLRMLCDRKECVSECLYTGAVIDSLLSPIQKLLKGKKVGNFGIIKVIYSSNFLCVN